MPIFHKKYVGTDFSKFKCRIVGLGNHWKNVHGVDTYASMVRVDTVKFLFAVGSAMDYDFFGTDIIEAFLTTEVNKKRPKRSVLDPDAPDQTYYLRRPPGVTDSEMPYISQPSAFVYGHPLANPEFNADTHTVLIKLGFIPCTYDSNVYVLDNHLGKAILARAVDDMPTIHNGGDAMRDFILAGLRETYEITVDDPLTAILGLEAFRDRPNRRTRLRQRGSMDDMLNEFLPGWRDMKPEDLPDSPMQERHVLGKKELALDAQLCTPAEITTYNRKEGCLNWLTYTGPDFIFATRHCSRFLKAPTLLNMHEIDRIIRCWARIRLEDEDGLWLGGKEGVQIISTVDSSYHSFPDMKSGTGGTLHMSHDTGSFMSLCDKQSITTDSAMACEGVGGHLQIRKLLPLRYFCQELGFPQL
jgi:hypothetical protein